MDFFLSVFESHFSWCALHPEVPCMELFLLCFVSVMSVSCLQNPERAVGTSTQGAVRKPCSECPHRFTGGF